MEYKVQKGGMDKRFLYEKFLNTIQKKGIEEKKREVIKKPKHFKILAPDPSGSSDRLILSLTHDCNLGCDYCVYENSEIYPEYRKRERGVEMDFKTAKRALDIGVERGIESISFYGGEPMLEPEATGFGFLLRKGDMGFLSY